MNINQAFPSKFLKASDLNDTALNVTIKSVKMEQVGQDGDIKPVVYFEQQPKGLVLNKTNTRKIVNIAGTAETDEWTGTVVQIYPTETEFGGETVECIRVREPKKVKPAATVTDEEVGF
jgi:hypothetical protein